jgi:hypothetical protein
MVLEICVPSIGVQRERLRFVLRKRLGICFQQLARNAEWCKAVTSRFDQATRPEKPEFESIIIVDVIEEIFGGQHGVDESERAAQLRVPLVNRAADKDAGRALTEPCA